MTDKQQNDFFYVCSLIEDTARRTNNQSGAIIDALGKDGVLKQLQDAEVNHCLSFEQVSDEIIEISGIKPGEFDTITNSTYRIPGFMDIGRLYSIMIEDCAMTGEEVSK